MKRPLTALLCCAAFLAAGCHNNNDASGYGIAWVTLTDSPGDFTSYIVNVDSITLTRSDGAVVTALGTAETVDFTKLNNIAELWGTATIPTGTYTSATLSLDYTYAVISVMVNGLPQRVNVVNTAGAAVTTLTVNVILDPANPLYIKPTYGTTAATRLALDLNLAASTTSINTSTTPATVTINPYFTAAISPPDNKLVRIRGPLINSSVDLLTYTVYVRPFFDEQNSLGSLTLFADPNTIYTISGQVTTGSAGLKQLSQSSAGTTVTAGYAAYQPTATPSATAADWLVKYVVAGSTLEDVYTQGLEGDVVARSGNTLTVRGATLQLNDGLSNYCGIPTASSVATVVCSPDATVLLGPSTIVTADDDATLTGLNYNSIAVGQHIIVRGILPGNSLPAAGTSTTIDATGASSTNTGSVRLVQTSLWGSIVSSSAGNLLLNVSTIDDWPITNYNFAGNGTSAAADPTGANFLVNTGAIALPDATVGDPSWVDGLVAPFGSAPPAFTASTVNDELSVQMVGNATPTAGATCGQAVTANLHCMPASLQVVWPSPGTTTPFLGLGGTTTINLAGASSAIIRIGAESIDMTTLPATPTFVATTAPAATTATAPNAGSVAQTLPPVFLPEYSYGIPAAVTYASGTVVAGAGISVFSAFATFSSGLTTALATTPALQFEARGTYDRASNTFTAISANVVL